ncbi:hypothetical protein P8V03_07460 [Clostridium sp. A1-XYC3]|uniref:HMA domain-containing protein n=1 Tax=Clostridium tanneri TaxID=3037988 RepID=A0ABU4JS72_9CLOT|nr:hypothetical protein [Clostridium sp. A1-XYC3]MDW8800990.1 hypothetical protein [Clostridium sp. A1-XYC3]
MKKRSDFDKLIDMFLYVLPKYLKNIDNDRYEKENIGEEALIRILDKIDFKELTKELIKEDKEANSNKTSRNVNKQEDEQSVKKSYHDDRTEKEHSNKNQVSEDKKDSKEDIDKVTRKIDQGKESRADEKKKEVERKGSDNQESDKQVLDNKKYEVKVLKEDCSTCFNGLKDALKKLIGERITLSLEGCLGGIIDDAILLAVENSIVKLKTREKTIVLIPINEIVSVKSEEISSMKFNVDSKTLEGICNKSMDLSRYFNLNVGKTISLRTKGEGEFKYISRKKITGSWTGVVVLEGNMLISICKVLLIEETD